jgi:DNA-binding transcriptional MerR regulator
MQTTSEPAAHYPIRAVSKLTGIAIDTLRAWERRYGAVTPARDDRGRLYSDADVARLRLLNQAVTSGHSVGRIATLSDAELRRLAAPPAAPAESTRTALDASSFRSALGRLDSFAVDREFSRLAALLPPIDLVREVLLPSLRDVGDNWHKAAGNIAQEHLISSTAHHLLGSFLRLHSKVGAAARLLFATPSNERHELGLLCAAMLAAANGLGVSYVGADLPAREIVEAVRLTDAHVLVLGLTLTESGSHTERELRAIVRGLPARTELWAGGQGAGRHAALLSGRGLVLNDFDEYLFQTDRIKGLSR